MTFMNWLPIYSVGIDKVDRQHQQLFKIANEFYDAVERGAHASETRAVLAELVKYTEEHFTHEEYLMLITRYPEFQSHLESHHELIKSLNRLVDDYNAGKSGLEKQLLDFLKTWLAAHIGGTDKLYASHLKEHGIK